MQTVITTHAVVRFTQRFRLQFHKDIFDKTRVKFFIVDLFAKATPCDFALKQSIGTYNRLCIQHDCKIHYSRYKNLVFAWKIANTGNIVVTTVMRSGNKIGHVVM